MSIPYRRRINEDGIIGARNFPDFNNSSPKLEGPSTPMGSPSLRKLNLRVQHTFSTNPRFWTVIFITLLSFATRLWYLHLPDSVCWDETHFGKFANYYIKRSFFFDVHPPLGKMLIALAGVLTGYDGNHEFKEPGQKFDASHYFGMRLLCATFGSLIAPCVYGIMTELDFSAEASALAALMIIFDTGILTLSRYILLDPILLFFIIFSIFCYCRFFTFRDQPFSSSWWRWLSLTGLGLACTFGTKWVGLFVIFFIGLSTVKDLWDLIGDLKLSVRTLNHHFMARALCLIILPISVYIFFFYIHFVVLHNSGPGDGFMSSAFQTTLKGNHLYELDSPRDLAYGSQLTLKAHHVSGGLLHSHPQTYPQEVGLPQQQVTTYSHKDSNNDWMIKRPEDYVSQNNDIEYVRHGDIIRLEHVQTGRNLHSHTGNAPITTKHKQVTCYGEKGKGDHNDLWQILLEDTDPKVEQGELGPVIHLLTSKFYLQHNTQYCFLSNQGVTLPQWGFGQGEITCNPTSGESGALWNVETIMDERLPKSGISDLTPSFWYNLWELHFSMASVNNNLRPKENEITSKPWQWPILYNGQHFSGSERRIYLMGNPLIWFGNLICAVVFVVSFLINLLLKQRGFESPFFRARRHKLQSNGTWIAIGFFVHYIPFFLMPRILYFHHYFPAHIFACMLTAIVLDEIFYWVWVVAFRLGMTRSKKIIHLLFYGWVFLYIGSFIFYSPFSYGMTGDKENYSSLRLFTTWDF